ncbi:hypothetical protein [Owenweeksia hongkongensis]|uniref:hypothetical protein n=1 Tax=Owenweeksia hongkongensis TaxID=253245 RepID=UPI003A91058C
MEFNPPIQSRSTTELIKIANYPEDWNPLAVKFAKNELAERGVSTEEQRIKVEAWDRQAKIEHHKELKRRAVESFGILNLIWMALRWPKTVLSDWSLKKGGYHRKRKERLYAIGAGLLCTLAFITWLKHESEISQQKWRNKVNSQDIYEWEKSQYTEEEIVNFRKEAIEQAIILIQENEAKGITTFLVMDNDTLSNLKVETLKELSLGSVKDVIFQDPVGSSSTAWIIIKTFKQKSI